MARHLPSDACPDVEPPATPEPTEAIPVVDPTLQSALNVALPSALNPGVAVSISPDYNSNFTSEPHKFEFRDETNGKDKEKVVH